MGSTGIPAKRVETTMHKPDRQSDSTVQLTRSAAGKVASAGSFIIHGAIVLTLVTASYLHIDPLAMPAIVVPLVRIVEPPTPPPPPPPPPPSGGPARIVQAPERPKTIPDETVSTVQPQEHTIAIPSPDEGTGEAGEPGGAEGGQPGGVPGGVWGGVSDGLINGIIGGFGDKALTGLRDPAQPIYSTGAVRPPERIVFFMPKYPEVARKARAEGKVMLEIVVGPSGDVEVVTIVRSNPLFDAAAVEAVRKWKYHPALQSGRPVRVYLTVIVNFELK